MKASKLCGYDLNGWRDFAVRNWTTQPGEDDIISGQNVIGGGLLSSVVRAGTGKAQRSIGGMQAEMAPHGRGGGWGQVGDEALRQSVRDLLFDFGAPVSGLAAALSGLGRSSRQSVLAIEDVPGTSEAVQDRLLSALREAKVGAPLLVWRSVLALIYALEQGMIDAPLGSRIGIVSQTRNGLSVQSLTLREGKGRSGSSLAPERRQMGEEYVSVWGYAALLKLATEAVMNGRDVKRSSHLKHLRMRGQLALGLPTKKEILRDAFSNWEEMPAISQLALPVFDLDAETFSTLSNCDDVILETLSEGRVASALKDQLEQAISRAVVALPSQAVATGALVAAQRIKAGEPVYFDFLPAIATIVHGRLGAENFDLIAPEETLPAGQVYRSPEPARFAIPSRKKEISVYLRKETEALPRKAIIDLGVPLTKEAPIELWVEQSPAAGRAKIQMRAPEIGRQFSVDWDLAEELDQDWQEIIDDLASPPPTIPSRLILPCGMQAWEGSNRTVGLLELLEKNDGRENVDWKSLAKQMSARPFRRYCISSDGDIPTDVPNSALKQLDRLTQRAIVDVRAWHEGLGDADTERLKFLTWQFKRCPEDLNDLILASWQSRMPLINHPFISHNSHWKLVYQGMGRIALTEESERRAFSALFERPVAEWKYDHETACMAFLLSRSDTVPLLLSRERVDALANLVVKEFRENRGSQYTKFNYAPLLLAGLLRWRLKEPHALIAGKDPSATKMEDAVYQVLKDFERRRARSIKLERAAKRFVPMLKDILEELRGAGSNPDLLLDIYSGGDNEE